MQCPQCRHDNSAIAKFCEECGAKLVRVCSACGFAMNPEAKFCAECGTPLTGRQEGEKAKGEKGEKEKDLGLRTI
jgi:predicted amidophosphoribosyltransferase